MAHNGTITQCGQDGLSDDNRILSALFQASPLAIVAIDANGNVTRWSRAAEFMFGWEAGEVLGKPYPFIPSERDDEQRNFIDKTRQGELLHDIRLRLLKKNGELFDVSISTAPVSDAAGNNAGLVAMISDMADRKPAEEEILRLNAELELRVADRTANIEASNRELEAFSFSVSHDLQAPLRQINSFNQVLSEQYGGVLDKQGQEYLSRQRNAVQRMLQLIEDLLKLARAVGSEMNRQPVNLSRLAQIIMLELKQTQPERRLTMKIAEGVMANGDSRLLRVALENLLGNAWKYTGKQEEAVIEFGASEMAGEMVCFVRDNGVGFDMAYADKLFGVFQRLHRADEFEGSGVGLATVQRIVQRHGGRIWAESAPGQGAIFYFTLQVHHDETT